METVLPFWIPWKDLGRPLGPHFENAIQGLTDGWEYWWKEVGILHQHFPSTWKGASGGEEACPSTGFTVNLFKGQTFSRLPHMENVRGLIPQWKLATLWPLGGLQGWWFTFLLFNLLRQPFRRAAASGASSGMALNSAVSDCALFPLHCISGSCALKLFSHQNNGIIGLGLSYEGLQIRQIMPITSSAN